MITDKAYVEQRAARERGRWKTHWFVRDNPYVPAFARSFPVPAFVVACTGVGVGEDKTKGSILITEVSCRRCRNLARKHGSPLCRAALAKQEGGER